MAYDLNTIIPHSGLVLLVSTPTKPEIIRSSDSSSTLEHDRLGPSSPRYLRVLQLADPTDQGPDFLPGPNRGQLRPQSRKRPCIQPAQELANRAHSIDRETESICSQSGQHHGSSR